MSGLSAMVLAAGRGERLRPLTDSRPKPLLDVAGKPLIEHALDRLAAAGVERCVVNVSWLAEQLRVYLQAHWRWDMELVISDESAQRLETGGGIFQALPELGEQAFLLVNADVYCDLPLAPLARLAGDFPAGRQGHLVLVDNPPHHPDGDFALDAAGRVIEQGQRLTYAGLAVLHPMLFRDCRAGCFPLPPLLRQAIQSGALSGERFVGRWTDVGTPQRLAALRSELEAA